MVVADDPSDVNKLAVVVVIDDDNDELIDSDEARWSLSNNDDWNVFIEDVSTFVTESHI